MKPQDLRIGNIIKFNGENCEIGYAILGDFAKKFKGIKNDYLDTLNFEPTNLSEEWLKKMGFKSTRCKLFENFYNLEILKYLQLEYNVHNNKCWINNVEMNNIKFVHQIQNLFHSLTGQELKIK